jgi:hypothetical protein
MTILRNISLLAIPLVACTCMATAQLATSPKDPSLSPKGSYTLTAVQDTVKAGSPVKVKVTTKNTWDRDLFVSGDTTGILGSVVVRDGTGDLAPETRRGFFDNQHWERKPLKAPGPEPKETTADLHGGSMYYTILKPGESWSAVQDVTMLFVLTKPGKYTVQMERQIATTEVPRTYSHVRSNIITITVTE